MGTAPSPTIDRRANAVANVALDHPPVDALVAIVPTRADFRRLQAEGWYRVPLAKAPAPLLTGSVRTLALYLPKAFGVDAWHVRWVTAVRVTDIVTRRQLLPDEPDHPRASDLYLRLKVDRLDALPRPIPSQRLRRIVFIPTTRAKLERAAEINDRFHASPLEDLLWEALKAEGISAEREYVVPGDRAGRSSLDFAVFTDRRNVDLECDGDAYHANPARATYDNRRNNFLTARGWAVPRFTTAQLRQELPEVMNQVRSTITTWGGTAHLEPKELPAQLPHPLWQAALWEPSVARGHGVDPRLPARPTRRRRR